jgi:hypothetical protein
VIQRFLRIEKTVIFFYNSFENLIVNPNPQLTGYGKPEKRRQRQNSEQWELELD